MVLIIRPGAKLRLAPAGKPLREAFKGLCPLPHLKETDLQQVLLYYGGEHVK